MRVDMPTLCREPAPTFPGGWQGVLTLILTLTSPTDHVSRQAGVGGPHTAVRGQSSVVWLAPSACHQPLVWPLTTSEDGGGCRTR